MAHLQYMPGDPRLVDQLVYELKSKGIFDQFRKDCIADVDTKPAYQNLRQRVENSVSTFLSRQSWQPDLNKNQLREKLRKHILDGNYLEQGVERIVDQVVNPKVATVFIPKVEDLVYNYLGITRKKSPIAEATNEKVDDLLPTDLEAVSPGSVKSNDEKNDLMEVDRSLQDNKMEVDEEKPKSDIKEDSNIIFDSSEKENTRDIQLPCNKQSNEIDKINIPLPSEDIKPENIPSPDDSPSKVELEKIELPAEPIRSKDIPLPNDIHAEEKDQYFKPINSEDDDSSSGSSLRRNMSPLTPIRNFNNENSCDAQQAFENDQMDNKIEDKTEPSSFRFKIDANSSENSSDAIKSDKKETEVNLSFQFNNQVKINNFNTPLYEDSSNSNNLHIDYESDANSKVNIEIKSAENDQNSEDFKKERKPDERKSGHKSSHRSRDSNKNSSRKDKKPDSKHSNSRDGSKHDKNKSSKEENKTKTNDKDKSKDKTDKKDNSRDSSRHRSSHKSSHKDSKSHRSSSSSGRHSSKHSDEKKSSSSTSNNKHKEKNSDKTSDKSKDPKSSSHRSDKDRKSSSSSSSTKTDKSSSKSKSEDKDKDKKSKKENDDHYSVSGRGNPNRRSTDRDSNDGSSSSKGSHNPSSSKSSTCKKDSKSSSKSETTSTSGESTSPSDKEIIICEHGSKTKETLQQKPIVRIESHLETPVVSPPRLPFVPDVTLKKPKFAANLEEAKRLMKMRKFLDEEQKRMNQEAALLLEFQANVRPSMSQVYSSIPGPELEFACITNISHSQNVLVQSNDNNSEILDNQLIEPSHYTNNELLKVLNDTKGNQCLNNINTEMENVGINFSQESLELTETDQIFENPTVENVELNSCSNEQVSGYKRSVKIKQEIPSQAKNIVKQSKISEIPTAKDIEGVSKDLDKVNEHNYKKQPNLFEITIITEELSEHEEAETNGKETAKAEKTGVINKMTTANNEDLQINNENKLSYFAEHEKYSAELERARFSNFFKDYNEKSLSTKLYLINCDTYEENLIREVAEDFGQFDIVSYHKNGHLKLPRNNIIRNVNISTEISLPIDSDFETTNDSEHMTHNVFSPVKSECSFELSNDYDTKLEEMVNKTSRQEIMEIILGNVIDASPSKMPRIDYLTDLNIDGEYENNFKRKFSDVETTVNNNRPVLTPNKIRKLSSDQITSTTHENDERPNNKVQNIARSKYLGKAKRVGLPRPRRSILADSPTSDKSVENYEQNEPTNAQSPNGKLKRSKVQRYDTSDLYKPKLHYLSRRNHIT